MYVLTFASVLRHTSSYFSHLDVWYDSKYDKPSTAIHSGKYKQTGKNLFFPAKIVLASPVFTTEKNVFFTVCQRWFRVQKFSIPSLLNRHFLIEQMAIWLVSNDISSFHKLTNQRAGLTGMEKWLLAIILSDGKWMKLSS